MFTIRISRRFRHLAATSALALAASAGLAARTASAGTSTVDFSSTSSLKGLAGFKGSATLDGDLLTVQVTNTASRGFLYGVAFDIEEGKAVYLKNDGKHGFKSDAGKHGLRIKPFGLYEDALAVGPNKRAIAAGASRTFLFNVSGAPADATAFDLLDNTKGASMVALFKGLRHGAHDKAGAAVVLRLATPASINDSAGGPATDSTPGLADLGGPTLTSPVILPPTLNPTGPAGGSKTGGSGGLAGGSSGSGGSINLPGGDPVAAAVPLPPAAWTGFGTLIVMAAVKLKRRFASALT